MISFGGGIFGGGGAASTVSGVATAGQVGIWSATNTLSGNVGLTYAGTGDTFHLKFGASGTVGLILLSSGALRVSDGSTGYGGLRLGALSLISGSDIVGLGTTAQGKLVVEDGTAAGVGTPGGVVAASKGYFIRVAAPVISSVTPNLTYEGSVTTVAGADLVDGDYFTLNDGGAYVFEFDNDATVTPGRIGITFTGAESADGIRDLVVIAANLNLTAATAVADGAATVSLTMDTPGVTGGANSENVANAGFAVAGFAAPVAATTYTYRVGCNLTTGEATEASVAGTTAAGHATLSGSNFNHIVWGAVPGAASYPVYRTVGSATQGLIGTVAAPAVSLDDTGLAGGGETPPATNGTGVVSASTANVSALPTYANNAAAAAGGLVAGDLYMVTASDPRQVAVVY